MNIKKLVDLMESNKITKAELAKRANITRQTLDNILSGSDMKISSLESIASAIGVSPSIFFDDTPIAHHNLTNVSAGRDIINGNNSCVETRDSCLPCTQVETMPIIPRRLIREPNVNIEEYMIKYDGEMQRLEVVPSFSSATYWVECVTPRMFPFFVPGDYISLKKMDMSGMLPWGDVVVADTKAFGLYPGYLYEADNGCFRLEANNQHYPDIIISRNDLFGMYKFVGLIRGSIEMRGIIESNQIIGSKI